MRSYKMSKIVVNAHQAMRGKYNNSVFAFSVQLTSKKGKIINSWQMRK